MNRKQVMIVVEKLFDEIESSDIEWESKSININAEKVDDRVYITAKITNGSEGRSFVLAGG